ncbi:hypothetical protein [Membranihabitans maritimus]|uniref:hypothetical protein n=1 Tax=Membranihabitans maritimus TaxID=2904244 RepID=UPI001F48937E|nr:hypothetical protein [Membranihabitans maritimus]
MKISILIARVISYIMHPVFLPVYMAIFYLVANPFQFGCSTAFEDPVFLIQTVVICTFFPVLTIFLMVRLKLISSFYLDSRMDRVGPYIAIAIFYIWYYLNIKNYGVAIIYEVFILGALIGLFLSFFINNFTKISIHSTGIAGVITNFIIANQGYDFEVFTFDIGSKYFSISFPIVIVISIIFGLLIVFSRLYLEKHTLSQILGGLLMGTTGQVIALKLVNII